MRLLLLLLLLLLALAVGAWASLLAERGEWQGLLLQHAAPLGPGCLAPTCCNISGSRPAGSCCTTGLHISISGAVCDCGSACCARAPTPHTRTLYIVTTTATPSSEALSSCITRIAVLALAFLGCWCSPWHILWLMLRLLLQLLPQDWTWLAGTVLFLLYPILPHLGFMRLP